MTRALALSAVLVTMTATPPPRLVTQSLDSTLLSQYAAGDYSGITQLSKSSLTTIQSSLDRLAKQLPSSTMDHELARRALAGLALEAARANVFKDFYSAERLLGWARDTLIASQKPGGEFDRRWHVAAVSILEGTLERPALERETAVALQQFPDDPRLLLGRAVAAEHDDMNMRDVEFQEASVRYRQALAHVTVRGEAQLRLGYLEWRIGQQASALERLRDAEMLVSGDQSLLYLARLFQGGALAGLTRWPEAEAQYRRALEAVPEAQAATLGLAAALFSRGARDEAARLADGVAKRPKPAKDPWWAYRAADFRLCDERVASMREAVR